MDVGLRREIRVNPATDAKNFMPGFQGGAREAATDESIAADNQNLQMFGCRQNQFAPGWRIKPSRDSDGLKPRSIASGVKFARMCS